MAERRSFRIVTSDKLSLDMFSRWHELLVSVARPVARRRYILPAHGFKFELRQEDLPIPDCDLTWGIESEGRTVQINPAATAGDANVLSAIGEDQQEPGRFAVLRQGRLQRNRETKKQISGDEFRQAFEKPPVCAVGSFGARHREWFLVCEISDDAGEVARQTADFVQRCAQVRSKFGKQDD